MKRSQMLQIMRDAFHEGMSYKEIRLSGMEREQAERVLMAMEKAGMMPPITKIRHKQFLWNGEEFEVGMPVQMWEAENETK